MAGLPHDRVAAVFFNVVVDAIRTLHIADDLASGQFFKHETAAKSDQFITQHLFAVFVDETNPIGIAVKTNTDHGSRFFNGAAEVSQVSFNCRIWVVIWERAVRPITQYSSFKPYRLK